jgi:hypothetical protein
MRTPLCGPARLTLPFRDSKFFAQCPAPRTGAMALSYWLLRRMRAI